MNVRTYSSNSVLIFGWSGFIGRRLCQKLVSKGFSVCRIGRHEHSDIRIDKFDDELILRIAQLTPDQAIVPIVSLLAPGVSPSQRHNGSVRELTDYCIFLQKLISSRPQNRLLYLSTSLLDLPGLGQDSYLEFMADLQGRMSSLDDTKRIGCLTLPRVFGPGEPNDRAIGRWISQSFEQKSMTVSEPCRTRNLVFVDDVTRLLNRGIEVLMGEQNTLAMVKPIRTSNFGIGKSLAALLKERGLEVSIRLPHIAREQCEICTQSDAICNVGFRGAMFNSSPITTWRSIDLIQALDLQVVDFECNRN